MQIPKYFGIYYITHLCQKYRCSWNGFIKEFRSCWGEIGLVKRNVVVTHWRWNMAALVIFWAWISLSLNRIYKYVKMSLGVIWKAILYFFYHNHQKVYPEYKFTASSINLPVSNSSSFPRRSSGCLRIIVQITQNVSTVICFST